MQFLRLLPTVSESCFASMALDESLFLSAIQTRSEIPILRFYQFSEKSLTLGFSQRGKELLEVVKASKTPWVRRPTGGGLVDHDEDLIFSLVLPVTIHPEFRTARSTYYLIHACIQQAFQTFKIKTDFQRKTCSDQAGYKPAQMICFERPVCDDLMLGVQKIVGGAERRSQGYILHQGSIQLEAIGQPVPDLEKAIIVSFEEKFNCKRRIEEASSAEATLRRELEEGKYRNSDWNTLAKVNSNYILADDSVTQ